MKNVATLMAAAMTALAGWAQPASLVPDKPYSGKTYDYFCTWNIQGFVADYVNQSGTGSPYIRAMMVEDNIFGGRRVYRDNRFTMNHKTVTLDDRYKDWAAFLPSLHGDLILMLDDSWDIPVTMNGRREGNAALYGGMAPFGTDKLDASRFPSFGKGSATARMKALVGKARGRGYGWKGLGLWVACNVPQGQDDESYWKARLTELGRAGVSYLKVDWDIDNRHERSVDYRKQLTDWGLATAPGLTLEHATFQGLGGHNIPDVVGVSEVVRTYDVTNDKAEASTIDRVAEILRGSYRPYREGWGIINCEDEPYIAAGLGCAIGIMRHPLVGNLPNGQQDDYFKEQPGGRRLKHRLNEVVRAIHWHRIAQPFGIGGDCHVSLNADGTMAPLAEGGKATYSIVSRDIDLPVYTDGEEAVTFGADGTTQPADFGCRPYILASHYPSGATAVAAVNRYKNGVYHRIGINVTARPISHREPVGIFGYFAHLTLRFKDGLPKGTVKVYAQDLADDQGTPTDITGQVTLNAADGSITIAGTTIAALCQNNKYPYDEVKHRNGLQDQDYTDDSDPAIVLKVESAGE